MKSVVQPCIGWGFHAGCDSDAEPSSFLFCFLSLPINGATSGSVKINLVLGIHDNYINQIKNMVEFENVENVKSNDITPQLIEGSDDN